MIFTKSNIRIYLIFFFSFFCGKNSFALESLSYSGRLVQTNGAPVTGPVTIKAELNYTNDLTAAGILCTQTIPGVSLANGVFHVKLDFDCTDTTHPSRTLTQVLSQAPAGESVAIKITDITHSKPYSYQALHSLPFATVASQLVQMAAGDGQVLQWSNSAKGWVPGTITVTGGTVTNVSVSAPLTISNPATTPSITITQANSTTNGYLSSADWNTFNNKQPLIIAGTNAQYFRGDKSWQTLDTSVVAENTNLYFTNARALGVPLTGFTTATGAIVATDSVLDAFGKAQGQINAINSATNNFLLKNSTDSITGTVNVGVTGALTITNTPALPTDAANKQYVDTKLALTGGTLSGALNLDNILKLKGATNYVTVKAHSSTNAYDFILPQTAGTAGYVLQTDGVGNLSWINPSSVTAGSGTVNSASIVDGSIVDADVNASAAIAQSKIANLTADLAGKEPTITAAATTKYFRGDKTFVTLDTSVVPENSNLYFTNARVLTAPLTGFVAGADTAIIATDTSLQAFEKAQGQLNNRVKKNGDTMSGVLTLDNDLKIKGGSNYVTVKGHASSAAYNLFLPSSAGTSGYVLSTDGSGNTSWINPSSVATGSGTVNSASITDGSIVDADVNASAAIAQSKIANLTTDLSNKQPLITAGTTSQYYRGDKTFVDLATDVRGTALTGFAVGANSAVVAADTTLGAFQKVQGQINATNTAVSGKEPAITAGTTSQYYRGDKTFVDLGTDVRGTALTGFVVGANSAIVAADTTLGAFQKVQGQINATNTAVSGKESTVTAGTTSQYYRGDKTWQTLNGAAVANTAAGNIAATNVQSALNELDSEKQANITSSSAITTGSVTTSLQNGVNLNPFGAAAGNTGEIRFYELAASGTNYTSLKAPDALAADINYVMPSAAPSAGQVLSSSAAGVMSWITLPTIPVSSVFGRTGAVVATAGDYTATQITNTPAGSIAATNVQAALNELDTDKQSLITAGTTAQYYRGDKTFVDFGTDVRATALTGFVVGANSAVVATDTTLAAFQKVQGQINATNTAVSGKEPAITAGTTAQYIRGDKTLSTFATDAINSVLSSFALNAGAKPTVATSDSIVGAFGKVQKYLNDINSDYVSKSANQTINGTLAINSATGFITVPTPVNSNDAVNKAYVDGFGQWLESGANIYFNSGNVGVGTNAPGALLQIGENTATSSAFRFVPSVADQSSIRFTTNATANWIQSGVDFTNDSKKDLKFSSIGGATTWMTLQGSTGYVGIGTATPDSPFQVAGDTIIGERSPSNTGTLPGGGNKLYFSGGPSGASFNTDNSDPIYIQRWNEASDQTELRLSVGDNKDMNDKIVFGTEVTGVFTPAMSVVSTGNVGIGTSNPLFKLHVGGSSAGGADQTVAQIGDANAAGSGPLYLTYNAPMLSGNTYFNSGWKYAGGNAKPASIGLAGGISFNTSNNAVGVAGAAVSDMNTSMYINTNGNIGMGTMSTLGPLTIDGTTTGGGNTSPIIATASTTTDAFSVLPWAGITYIGSGIYYKNGAWVHKGSGATNALFGIGGSGGTWWSSNNSAASFNVASSVSLWNASGVLLGASSRDWKENFTELKKPLILQKINRLNISRWNYKNEGEKITHIGPIAEEWAREFHTGEDNKHIALIDEAGVALAGIQGLSQQHDQLRKEHDSVFQWIKNTFNKVFEGLQGHDEELAVQKREIASLKAENAKLKKENEATKARLDKIEKALNVK